MKPRIIVSATTNSDKIYWNTREIYKFYNFNAPPFNLNVEIKKILEKKVFQNQHWVQGEGGGRVVEEIYEIFVFVPFILSGIVEGEERCRCVCRHPCRKV